MCIENLEVRRLLSTAVLQYHNDNFNDGQNLTESLITPSTLNTSQFQKQSQLQVDGQVYAQPLYVPNVNVGLANPANLHNVVYVATENDTLYAVDAQGGNAIWHVSFANVDDPSINVLGASAMGVVPAGASLDTQTNDTAPNVGITSTPVIDPNTNVMYLLAKTKQTIGGNTNNYVQTIYAVDIRTGGIVGSTVIGDTTYSNGVYGYRQNADPYSLDPRGNGAGVITVGGQKRVYFNALREFNRSALELSNGQLYIGFASHGDNGPYHGWILRYDEISLTLTGALNVTPDGEEGGIWMAGAGPAIDANGDLYFMTGNGTFDGNKGPNNTTIGLDVSGMPQFGNYGDCFVRVTDDSVHTSETNQNINGFGMQVADYFAPQNNQTINAGDGDLGSGGLLLLPAAVGSTAHPNLMIGAGKSGEFYLLDDANMGHFSATTDNIVGEQGFSAINGTGINGSLGTPGFFMNPGSIDTGTIIWFPGYTGNGRAFSISNATLSSTAISQSTDSIGTLNGTVSISANGSTNTIAWVLDHGSSQLKAYLGSNLATQLWNSNQAGASRDHIPGPVEKFSVPTVADGQVFVGTAGTVNAGNSGWIVIYGPPVAPTSGPLPPTMLTGVATAFDDVSLAWQDNSNNEQGFFIERSSDNGQTWNQVGNVGANVANFDDTSALETTTYEYEVVAYNAFNGSSISAPTNIISATTPQAPPIGTGDGLAASFYNNVNLTGTPVLTRVDTTINFNFNGLSPAAGVNANNFSAMWTGKIQPAFSQTYTFTAFSDDGVRLFINGQAVINDWVTHAATTDVGVIALSGGQKYIFELDYYQGAGPSQISLKWSSTSQAQQIVPQSQLYSGVAPAAPSNLTAAGTSSTTIHLNWQSNSTIQTGFDIYRSQNLAGTYNIVASVGPTVFLYDDTGLSPNTTYYYYVQADNFAANSAHSNITSVLTPIPPATATHAAASEITMNSILLTWQNNATNADAYRILQQAQSETFIVIAAALPADSTSYLVTGLPAATEFDFHIIAYNVAGYSDFAGASTATLTPPPTAVSLNVVSNHPVLNWTAPDYGGGTGNLSFNVYRSPTGNLSDATLLGSSLTNTTFTDANASPNQNAFYWVTAVDPGGPSQRSTLATTSAALGWETGSTLSVNLTTAGGVVNITSSNGSIALEQNGATTNYPAVNGIVIVGNASNEILNYDGGISAPILFVSEGGADSLNVNSGSFNFAAPSAGSGVTTVALSNITIAQGAQVVLSSPASNFDRNVLVLGSLVQSGNMNAWQSSLDLGNNDLIIHNGNLAQINNQIRQGMNLAAGGFWNGEGIISSKAAGSSRHNVGVGVAVNNDGSGHTLYSSFDGLPVSLSDVLVKYTFIGDADLSGVVDAADASAINNGLSSHLAGWQNGDFNYDNRTDGDDFSLMDGAFNSQSASPLSQVLPAVAAAATHIDTFCNTFGPAATNPPFNNASAPISFPVAESLWDRTIAEEQTFLF